MLGAGKEGREGKGPLDLLLSVSSHLQTSKKQIEREFVSPHTIYSKKINVINRLFKPIQFCFCFVWSFWGGAGGLVLGFGGFFFSRMLKKKGKHIRKEAFN